MSGKAKHFGLIAGSGLLPVTLAKRLSETGETPFLISIDGVSDLGASGFQSLSLPLERIAYSVPILKKHGVTHVVLAGGVKRRPNPLKLRVPVSLWPEVPGAVMALTKGDDGLLAAMVKMFERHGMTIVGAHDILPDHVAFEGVIAGKRPAKAYETAIQTGIAAALIIGAHDIGQAVVSIDRRVIAVEGIEGTDQMLARIGPLRVEGRISTKAKPVLVKLAKPNQELRADMPVIGPQTIEGCVSAGIDLVCVSAGTTMIMDVARTVEMANATGITIFGLDPSKWVAKTK